MTQGAVASTTATGSLGDITDGKFDSWVSKNKAAYDVCASLVSIVICCPTRQLVIASGFL
jgi:hypothetical protein